MADIRLGELLPQDMQVLRLSGGGTREHGRHFTPTPAKTISTRITIVWWRGSPQRGQSRGSGRATPVGCVSLASSGSRWGDGDTCETVRPDLAPDHSALVA